MLDSGHGALIKQSVRWGAVEGVIYHVYLRANHGQISGNIEGYTLMAVVRLNADGRLVDVAVNNLIIT